MNRLNSLRHIQHFNAHNSNEKKKEKKIKRIQFTNPRNIWIIAKYFEKLTSLTYLIINTS